MRRVGQEKTERIFVSGFTQHPQFFHRQIQSREKQKKSREALKLFVRGDYNCFTPPFSLENRANFIVRRGSR
jgi:hypothetical protein